MKALKYPTVREALLYKNTDSESVMCELCNRKCIIRDGQMGFCKTRINREGKLYTLVYGDINALSSRPIEIKPFFHFYPGSTSLTFSTWSCNFTCPWCQNYHLSKKAPNPKKANYISPENIVDLALKMGDEGVCVSFTEPTLLFEYSLDVFKLAKKHGLYTSYVSNGYITEKALVLLKNAGMDAINIDIKGDSKTYKKYCGNIKAKFVWNTAKKALDMGIHVEIVNLIVTGVNDNLKTIKNIVKLHLKNLGPEVPIHFTRYFPAFKFNEPPTKIEVLEKAYEIAKDFGILYPYLGNVPGHKFENTYCPKCGELLIKRRNFKILRWKLKNFKCPKCKFPIKITGEYVAK
ncbi:Radical SAM domain protein [Methanothermus fervidus DSM 2088]|uniref:Radical SAM domain protein n=1 Tax=Methanothermus fervidus (strain ATCC 43054 / DSM 2088 / JCM 10308 / V24 S) TaxID=523846 RepID=E3GZJ0_METFV|nr:AmmeMemoRadiSam system radical SAM enzyme [Methanothermus fervidus]ADP77722.1 Radical SAM domain protein [Methanothermus fervidus DSM 2088]